jgi:hypothetical protein
VPRRRANSNAIRCVSSSYELCAAVGVAVALPPAAAAAACAGGSTAAADVDDESRRREGDAGVDISLRLRAVRTCEAVKVAHAKKAAAAQSCVARRT